MTLAHQAMDICLWLIVIGWFCNYIAKHPGPSMKQRGRLGKPSPHCERTPDWAKIHQVAMTRRQAE